MADAPLPERPMPTTILGNALRKLMREERLATIAEVRWRVEAKPVLGLDLGVSGATWIDPQQVIAILDAMAKEARDEEEE